MSSVIPKTIAALLSIADIEIMSILYSHAGGVKMFSSRVTSRQKCVIVWGGLANLLFKDWPQFVIQILYKSYSPTYTLIPLLTLASSSLMLLVNLATRISYARELYKAQHEVREEESPGRDEGHTGITDTNIANEERNIRVPAFPETEINVPSPVSNPVASSSNNPNRKSSQPLLHAHPSSPTNSSFTPTSTPTSTPVRVPTTPTTVVHPLNRFVRASYITSAFKDVVSEDEGNDESEDESDDEDEIEQEARSSDKGKSVSKDEDSVESVDIDDPVSITVPGFTWRRGMASIANVDTDDG
ncbi:7718_t:CDS:2 [Paraglomus occultum]|uniref:7718_t:CDS:1 n=1 Tax=Paraglomus occultum TaxID=144539 RepID=A0A9N8W5P0_9GLOM|nr:7718_t:CDS:2 [Paraglomus occultum]